MKIKVSVADFDEPCETNPILSEARARIIWGEEASSVRSYLVASGVDSEIANSKIMEYSKERNAAVRSAGVNKIVVGGLLLVLSGLSCFISTKSSQFVWSGTAAKGLAILGAIGCYGFCKLVNGVIYLAHPQFEQESISDME